MRLYIKNMVCNRCIAAVKGVLEQQGFSYKAIHLGEVELSMPLTAVQQVPLQESLESLGFELLDDSKTRLIEKIKSIIVQQVHYSEEEQRLKLSALLTSQLHKDYSYLSHLFSAVEGITIEKYWIAQKIEKVKELLVYDELTLSEIAFRLGYSSVAHLSAQFKKVTGLTPSHFKRLGTVHRKPLDSL
jgi:AraC-like DNA-binding protein